MNLQRIQALLALGPYTAHFAKGVTTPQTTLDSGHVLLGSSYSKGNEAKMAARQGPLFCLVPEALLPACSNVSPSPYSNDNSNVKVMQRQGKSDTVEVLPLAAHGRVFADHIVMTPLDSDSENPNPKEKNYQNQNQTISPFRPSLSGDVSLIVGKSAGKLRGLEV